MRFEVIFFDAAGTLITPAEPVGAVYARLGAKHGLQTDAGALNTAFRAVWRETPPPLHPEGQPPADDDRSWWQSVAARSFEKALGAPVEPEVMEPLFAQLYAHYAEASAWAVYPEVRAVLQDLAADHRLVVLSNFDQRLRQVLAGHDLLPFFEHVVISSEVGASKPHERMFETALRLVNAPPSVCLHAGDDPRCDVDGAKLAGLQFFAVERPACGLDQLVRLIRAA